MLLVEKQLLISLTFMKTIDLMINLSLKQQMKGNWKKIEFMLSRTDTICHARSCTHHFNLEDRRQFLNFDMKYYVVSFTWTSWQHYTAVKWMSAPALHCVQINNQDDGSRTQPPVAPSSSYFYLSNQYFHLPLHKTCHLSLQYVYLYYILYITNHL